MPSTKGMFGTAGQRKKELEPCGTVAAARRHRRRGEPLDESCKQAVRREQAERKGQQSGAQTPDPRVRRNGWPEFKPYVYGATRRKEAAS